MALVLRTLTACDETALCTKHRTDHSQFRFLYVPIFIKPFGLPNDWNKKYNSLLRQLRHTHTGLDVWSWMALETKAARSSETLAPIYQSARSHFAEKTGYVRVKITLRAQSLSHFYREKSSNYYIFWVCVFVALVIQHAKRMRCIILLSAACLPVPYFSIFFTERHVFQGKKVTEPKMRVLILSATFIWNISHPKKNPARRCRKYTKT